jgi:RNA polymerase sigma factor (sigma-70 family)
MLYALASRYEKNKSIAFKIQSHKADSVSIITRVDHAKYGNGKKTIDKPKNIYYYKFMNEEPILYPDDYFTTHTRFFDKIYKDYGPEIFRCCELMLRKKNTIYCPKDAFQIIFIEILKLIQNNKLTEKTGLLFYNNEKISQPGHWFWRIAKNRCKTLLGKKDGRIEGVFDDPETIPVNSIEEGLIKENERNIKMMKIEEIKEIVNRKNPVTQKIFYLHFLEGKTYEDIGKIVGRETSSVGRTCKNLLEKIKKELGDKE